MADPLTITSASVAILSNIFTLSKQTSTFVLTAKDARKDMDGVRQELSSLELSLLVLQDYDFDKRYPKALQEQLVQVLNNCKHVTVQMQELLDKLSSVNLGRKIQWAFNGRDQMNSLRSSLEAHKSTISLALEMALLATVQATTDDISLDTKTIKEETKAIKEDTALIPVLRDELNRLLEKNIKEGSALIPVLLEEIRRLKDQNSRLEMMEGKRDILNKFLAKSEQYAQSVVDPFEDQPEIPLRRANSIDVIDEDGPEQTDSSEEASLVSKSTIAACKMDATPTQGKRQVYSRQHHGPIWPNSPNDESETYPSAKPVITKEDDRVDKASCLHQVLPPAHSCRSPKAVNIQHLERALEGHSTTEPRTNVITRETVPSSTKHKALVQPRQGFRSTEIELGGNLPSLRPFDIIIAVMGVAGSGKSTFIQHFSNREVIIGGSLEFRTARVDILRCSTPSIPEFYLIDMPGFDYTRKTDTEVLREITNWLSMAYTAGLKLTGIIYLHRIRDVGLYGSAKNIRIFKKLCGDNSLASVVLATTFWGMAKNDIEQSREAQLITRSDFWGHCVQKGSKVFRHDQGKDSAVNIIDYLVNIRRPVVLEIQREMVDQKMTLDQTGAGVEIQRDPAKAKAKYEEELAELRADMQELTSREAEWQEKLAAAKKEIEEELRKNEESRAQLQIDRERLKREVVLRPMGQPAFPFVRTKRT